MLIFHVLKRRVIQSLSHAAPFVALVLVFTYIEINRTNPNSLAGPISLIAWILIFALTLKSIGRKDVVETCQLASCAFFPILLIYLNSDLWLAGLDADNVYTYASLKEFLMGHNPITLSGSTHSYHQFAMMFFIHLPGAFLFSAIGPKALHLGSIFALSLSIAALVKTIGPNGYFRKALVSLFIGGFLANRLIINAFDNVAYFMPALFLSCIVLAAARDLRDPNLISKTCPILVVSLLAYYSSWFVILPLYTLILVLRNFLKIDNNWTSNSIISIFFVLIVTSLNLGLNSNLLMRRLKDVSVGQTSQIEKAEKLKNHWVFFKKDFIKQLKVDYFIENPGRWHMLKGTAICGLPLLFVTLLSLFYAICITPKAELKTRWAALGLILLGLILLILFQHLTTDFEVKRDLVFFFVLFFVAGSFLFDVFEQEQPKWKVVTSMAIGFIVFIFNFIDVTNLKYHYRTTWLDRPHSQTVLEYFRKTKDFDIHQLTYIVQEIPNPLFLIYKDVIKSRRLNIIDSKEFCKSPDALLQKIDYTKNRAVTFVVNWNVCGPDFRRESNSIYSDFFKNKEGMRKVVIEYSNVELGSGKSFRLKEDLAI